MSDESQPPQLRLRPRKRDDEPVPAVTPAAPAPSPDAPPAVPPSTPVGTPPASSEAAPRFRLKPKLNAGTEEKKEEHPVAAATTPSSVSLPEPQPAPSVSAIPSNDELAGVPRLKLRMLDPVAPDAGVKAEIAPLPVATVPGLPPPVPVPMTTAAPPPLVGGLPVAPPPPGVPSLPPLPVALPPLPPLRPLPPLPPPVTKAGKMPAATSGKKKKIGLVVGIALVSLALGTVSFLLFLKEEPPPPVVVTPRPKPVPVKPVSADVNGVSTELPPSPTTPVGLPLTGSKIAPLPPPPAPSASASTSKGGIQVVVANSAAAAAFRVWIDGVRISGVVLGESPRAIINGRLVRPGDVVDASEGIVFDGVDVERKQVVFRNRTGLFASKPY